MSEAITALAGFGAWTLILAIVMVSFRGINSFSGAKIPLNKFSPSGDDLPGFGRRITRAHLNCVETLPVFVAVIAAAALAEQMAMLEGTVMYILYARIAQSTVHMISASTPMVFIRASLFFVQVLLMLYYVKEILL